MVKNISAPPLSAEQLLKISEVAAQLGVSSPIIRQRVKSLGIPLYVKGTNTRTKYVRIDDVPKIRELGEAFHLWKPSLAS